jgi:hypothetical protein
MSKTKEYSGIFIITGPSSYTIPIELLGGLLQINSGVTTVTLPSVAGQTNTPGNVIVSASTSIMNNSASSITITSPSNFYGNFTGNNVKTYTLLSRACITFKSDTVNYIVTDYAHTDYITSSGSFKINSPITMTNTTMSTPSSKQLGYTISATSASGSSTVSELTKLSIIVPVGVWIVNANVYFNRGSPLSWGTFSISNTNNQHAQDCTCILSGSFQGAFGGTVTKFLVVTTATITQYLVVNSSAGVSVNINNLRIQAMRIA